MKRAKSLFCLLLLSFLSWAQFSYGESRVRVGFLGLAGHWFPLWVALDRGFFQREGLDVELIHLNPARLMYSALHSGEIQFAIGSAGSSVLAQSGGLQLQIIMAVVGQLPFEMWSIPSVTSLKDLKGKKVGGSPGGIPDLIIEQALKKVGLTTRDILRYNIGENTQRFAALKVGVVDVTVIAPPLTHLAKQEGFHRLARASEIVPEVSAASVTVKKDYLKRNQEIALKFSRALVNAIQFSKTKSAEAIETITKWTKQKAELAQDTYETVVPLLVSDGRENLEGIRLVIEYSLDKGLLKGHFSPQQFVDLEFQKRLLAR